MPFHMKASACVIFEDVAKRRKCLVQVLGFIGAHKRVEEGGGQEDGRKGRKRALRGY